ncbi:MAG TPA: hypothetical protein VIJ63_09345 [Roseiarcus sp.]
MLASAVTALALIAAPNAKANVVETFNLSGSFRTVLNSAVLFTGTIDLNFSNDFTQETLESMSISVNGRPVFNRTTSLRLAASANGVINAYNSGGDMLTLTFATPSPAAWFGFNQEAIAGGQVIFGGVTGVLFGATGAMTRDPSDSAILAPPPPIVDPPPPILDPPVPITSAAVPELSTWALMLIGLAGLGLAAKRRRALGSLGGRA